MRQSMVGAAVVLFCLCGVSSWAQRGQDLYQQALVQERAAGDLEKAIELFRSAAKEAEGDRELAAKALIGAARCYEKLGQTKSKELYEEVERAYGDQRVQAAYARERIDSLAFTAAGGFPGVPFPFAPSVIPSPPGWPAPGPAPNFTFPEPSPGFTFPPSPALAGVPLFGVPAYAPPDFTFPTDFSFRGAESVNQITELLTDLRRRDLELSRTLRPDHPNRAVLRRQIAELEASLNGAIEGRNPWAIPAPGSWGPPTGNQSADFDITKPVTFTGIVKAWEFVSPNVYLHVEVKEGNGQTVIYHVKGASPGRLNERGVKQDALKVGDTVTVSGFPDKDPASTTVGIALVTTTGGNQIFLGYSPLQ